MYAWLTRTQNRAISPENKEVDQSMNSDKWSTTTSTVTQSNQLLQCTYIHSIITTQRIQWMMHMEQSRQHNAHEHQDCTIAQGIIRPSDNPSHIPTQPIFVLFLETKQQYTSLLYYFSFVNIRHNLVTILEQKA